MDQQLYDIDQKLNDIKKILSNAQDQAINNSHRKEENLKEINRNSRYLLGCIVFIGIVLILLSRANIFETSGATLLVAILSSIISTCAVIIAMKKTTN